MMPDDAFPNSAWISPSIGGLATYAHKQVHESIPTREYLKRIATKEEAKAAKIWVEGEKSRLQDMQVQISGQCEDYPHKAEIETIEKLLKQSAGVV